MAFSCQRPDQQENKGHSSISGIKLRKDEGGGAFPAEYKERHICSKSEDNALWQCVKKCQLVVWATMLGFVSSPDPVETYNGIPENVLANNNLTISSGITHHSIVRQMKLP